MLGLAGALGALSFLSEWTKYHLGHGAIPFWIPLALDAGIAAVCGVLLTVAGPTLTDDGPSASADHVYVARSVWNDLQREIVTARGGTPPRSPPVGATAPTIGAAARATDDATAASPAPSVAPWDEGPPLSVAPEGGPPASVAPVAVPAAAPPAPVPHAPGASAAEPELSNAELEEIARMGGILGVVPRPGETGRAYSGRLAAAREALANGAPPPGPAPAPSPSARTPLPEWSEAEPASKVSADIDELMVWLEKMVAEPPGGPVTAPAKKPDPKTTPDDSGSTSPPP